MPSSFAIWVPIPRSRERTDSLVGLHPQHSCIASETGDLSLIVDAVGASIDTVFGKVNQFTFLLQEGNSTAPAQDLAAFVDIDRHGIVHPGQCSQIGQFASIPKECAGSLLVIHGNLKLAHAIFAVDYRA